MFYQSVYESIGLTVNLQPNGRAAIGRNINASYQQLRDDIDHVTRYLMSQGVKQGDRVLVTANPTYMHAVFVVALDRLGAASMSNRYFKEEAEALKFTHVFSIAPRVPEAPDANWIDIKENQSPSALPVAAEFATCDLPNDMDPDRVVRYIRSSGTTGNAKIIELTRDLVMKRVLAHHLMVEGAGTNRHLLTMPSGTIAGYGYLLAVFLRGATLVCWLPNDDFSTLVDTFQISHLLLTPAALRNMVVSAVNENRTHDSVKMVTTGGAPFESRLIKAAQHVLGPNIWNGYTSTEAGSVARGHVSQVDDDPQMIGPRLPFVELEIVDDDDNVVGVNMAGRVRVRSELAVDHYVYGDGVGVFKDGWYYPGDLGSLDNRGFLKIMGRTDGLINIEGVKFLAEDVERSALQVEGIDAAAIFMLEGSRKLYLALELSAETDHETIFEAVREQLNLKTTYQMFVVDQLPRNQMGKVDRPQLSTLVPSDLG